MISREFEPMFLYFALQMDFHKNKGSLAFTGLPLHKIFYDPIGFYVPRVASFKHRMNCENNT